MGKYFLLLLTVFYSFSCYSARIEGTVEYNLEKLAFVKVKVNERITFTDVNGYYTFSGLDTGVYKLSFKLVGYEVKEQKVIVKDTLTILNAEMKPSSKILKRVVISGGLKEVSKSRSPVPVEVISSKFLKANPSSSVFESLQNVNGVRPQNNCNVCNTGDIHINGLEGAYTMILIDGMPIVGGLSSVYGLSGIPQVLIERVEIVKGPASTLYGSEAVGGLVNVITKNPINAPKMSFDARTSSWGEFNLDLGYKSSIGKRIENLSSLNYFKYNNIIDNNADGFTDLTLQDRISVFSKFLVKRKSNKLLSLAARYNYEDRWGGQLDWAPKFRGGDSVYGESIYTKRYELFGLYELPMKMDLKLQVSSNYHNQNSYYGSTSFFATQQVNFAQLVGNNRIGKKATLLTGLAYRHTFYDDNTFATAESDSNGIINKANITHLPGAFIQHEYQLKKNKILLSGLRYDYNTVHGHIFTPRLNYKWNSHNRKNIIRWSLGNGYRVANIFTEDHAALTGARTVEFLEELKPETSWNANLNYVRKMIIGKDNFISLDASVWYTYFDNKIIPDYISDPNKITYQNLDGYAVSQGASVSFDIAVMKGLTANIGATLMDVSQFSNNQKTRQLLTEQFSSVWKLSYEIPMLKMNIDYTGNLYSPMLLPTLGPLDQRSNTSPWYSVQNVKISRKFKAFDLYGGVKNLLNFTPANNSIARAQDPFDKQVQFDGSGNIVATANNPQALSFDPSYVYASNQGRRFYLGLSYSILK